MAPTKTLQEQLTLWRARIIEDFEKQQKQPVEWWKEGHTKRTRVNEQIRERPKHRKNKLLTSGRAHGKGRHRHSVFKGSEFKRPTNVERSAEQIKNQNGMECNQRDSHAGGGKHRSPSSRNTKTENQSAKSTRQKNMERKRRRVHKLSSSIIKTKG